MQRPALALAVVFALPVLSVVSAENVEFDFLEMSKVSPSVVRDAALNSVELAVDGKEIRGQQIVVPAVHQAYSLLKASNGDVHDAVEGLAFRETFFQRVLDLIPEIEKIGPNGPPLWQSIQDAALIAALYGHDLSDRDVRNKLLLLMFGPAFAHKILDAVEGVALDRSSYVFASSICELAALQAVELNATSTFNRQRAIEFAQTVFRPGQRVVGPDLYQNAPPAFHDSTSMDEIEDAVFQEKHQDADDLKRSDVIDKPVHGRAFEFVMVSGATLVFVGVGLAIVQHRYLYREPTSPIIEEDDYRYEAFPNQALRHTPM